jgi:hypothetical protein
MRLVFFGAGASFGSEPCALVPPLGAKLFDELVRFAPSSWGRLPVSWQAQFRADFEPAMAAFINAGGFGAPLQWDMAEYFYTQFTATTSSAYCELVRRLSSRIEQYLFVTINYDMLLFQARALAGVPSEKFAVCLPHGNSCLRCVGISASGGVSFTGGISTGGEVRPIRDLAEFRSEKAQNVFPPVMSYFEPNKFTASCSNFIDAERTRFEKEVLAAERVAIVGVRVHLVDRHIWEPLAKTTAKLLYLSGPSAVSDFSTWASGHARVGDLTVPKYFRDGLADLIGFLS